MQERKRLDVTVVYLHQAFISFVVLYKRGFVMFGVVSLTMGNSGFPVGNCLPCNIEFFGQFLLRKIKFRAIFFDLCTDFHNYLRSAFMVVHSLGFVYQKDLT